MKLGIHTLTITMSAEQNERWYADLFCINWYKNQFIIKNSLSLITLINIFCDLKNLGKNDFNYVRKSFMEGALSNFDVATIQNHFSFERICYKNQGYCL